MPNLTIIAGCNGAGKSTFAPSFLPDGVFSFDYDKLFLEYYRELPDSELRVEFAKQKAIHQFELAIDQSLESSGDFCYETNFDAHPVYWVEKFRHKGFRINMIFFCLEDQSIARHRIQVRTEHDGHFVNNQTIDYKWREGYKNLNIHFRVFNNILFVDNSTQNMQYTNILQIEEGRISMFEEHVPGYFAHRLPEVYKYLVDLGI